METTENSAPSDPVLTEEDEAILHAFGFALDDMAALVRKLNDRWWRDPKTGALLQRNKGEQLMLVVSEIAEAMEGVRKNLPDDKLPEFRMETVEIADAIIRELDYAAGHGLPLGSAFVAKMLYNLSRPDHKLANRAAPGGKAF